LVSHPLTCTTPHLPCPLQFQYAKYTIAEARDGQWNECIYQPCAPCRVGTTSLVSVVGLSHLTRVSRLNIAPSHRSSLHWCGLLLSSRRVMGAQPPRCFASTKAKMTFLEAARMLVAQGSLERPRLITANPSRIRPQVARVCPGRPDRPGRPTLARPSRYEPSRRTAKLGGIESWPAGFGHDSRSPTQPTINLPRIMPRFCPSHR
jgi:hypothetical protein